MKTAALMALLFVCGTTAAGADPIPLEDDFTAALRALLAAGPDGADGATSPDVLQAGVIRGVELVNQTGNPGSEASFTTSGGTGTLSLTGANAGESALLTIVYLATGSPLDLSFAGGFFVDLHLDGPPVGTVTVDGIYADGDANRGVWKAPAGTSSSLIRLVPENVDPVDPSNIRQIEIQIALGALSDASLTLDSIVFVPEPSLGVLALALSAWLGLDRAQRSRAGGA